METEMDSFLTLLDVLLGNTRSSAFVVTNVDVIMKNMSSRNTISVILAMLKSALILFRVRMAMA